MARKSNRQEKAERGSHSRTAKPDRSHPKDTTSPKSVSRSGYRWWMLALILFAVGAAYLIWPAPRIVLPKPTSFMGIDPEIAAYLDRAIGACQKVNTYGDRYLTLARSYQANGFSDLAIDTYTHFLQANPKHAEAWFLRGICAERIGNLALAVESMERCIALDAPYPPCYWRLALWKIETGDAATALDLLEACDRLTTNDHAAKLVRAKAHLELDQAELALRALDEFDFSKTPNEAYAKFLRGTAWQRLGQFEKSRQHLGESPPMPVWMDPWSQDVERIAIGMPARRFQATNLFRSGNYAAARKLLESIVNESTADSRDWSMLGAILINEKQPERANECYHKALSFTPSDPWLYYHLARSCAAGVEQGDSKMEPAGLEAIGRALQLSPRVAEFYEMKGKLLELGKKPDEALAAYDQACSLTTRTGTCHWNRVFLLVDLRKWEVVRAQLHELSKAGSVTPEFHLAAAAMAVAKGDQESAGVCLGKIPAGAFEFDEARKQRLETLQTAVRK